MNGTTNLNLIGWTLIASVVCWILQLIFVSLLYIVGGPFGALSDFTNALAVLFMLPFGFTLHAINKENAAALSLTAWIIGIAGILSVAIASFLIFFGLIDFQQSLPPVMVGFTAIGVWLLISFMIVRSNGDFPRAMSLWGILIGLGLASISLLLIAYNANPLLGGDWRSFLSNPLIYPALILLPLGYLSYPFWAIWVGRMYLSNKFSFAN